MRETPEVHWLVVDNKHFPVQSITYLGTQYAEAPATKARSDDQRAAVQYWRIDAGAVSVVYDNGCTGITAITIDGVEFCRLHPFGRISPTRIRRNEFIRPADQCTVHAVSLISSFEGTDVDWRIAPHVAAQYAPWALPSAFITGHGDSHQLHRRLGWFSGERFGSFLLHVSWKDIERIDDMLAEADRQAVLALRLALQQQPPRQVVA